MKRIIQSIGLATILVLLTASAGLCENGQAIYDRYKKTEKKMEKAIGNIVMTLVMEAEGNVTETTIYMKGKKRRMESVVKKSNNPMMGKPGDKTIIIDDGITSTIFSPQLGQMSHPSEAGEIDEEAPKSVAYLGKEKVEGLKCHKIKVTRAYGEVETLWIAVKGDTLVKEESTTHGETTVTLNSDFKKVKGFLLPHATRTFEDGTLSGSSTITRVKTGAKLKESLFDASKVEGYAKGSTPQLMDPASMMGRMMEMGMEIERLNREGKTEEAAALQKQLEEMAAGMGGNQ